MAKPDLANGYIRYAHELDAAIAVADFTKFERIVLREVLAVAFFGERPKRLPVAISPTDIAIRVGGSKRNYVRAIADLIASGVLMRAEKGRYLFLKDYERWTRNGQPRLTASEIRYCRDAASSNASTKQGDKIYPQIDQRIPEEGGQDIPLRGYELSPDDGTPGGMNCPPLGVRIVPQIVPPRTPLVGREEEEAGGVAGAPAGEPPIVVRTPRIEGSLKGEIDSLKALTLERWNAHIAAEIEMWAWNDTGIDLEALRYAVEITAADRDRNRKRIDRPVGFIRKEYQKWFRRAIPPGPVEPRGPAEAETHIPFAPKRLNRTEQLLEELDRRIAAQEAT